VRSRQLHRHEPLRTMQEWLLWTGLSVFGLLLVATIFEFYFFVVVLTLDHRRVPYSSGSASSLPADDRGYNEQLRRARFFSQARYKNPEATVRTKRSRGQRRRRC
jgi:hypothetical protein